MACVDYPNSNGWFHTVELFFFFFCSWDCTKAKSVQFENRNVLWADTHQTSKTPIRLTQTFLRRWHICSHARSIRRRTDNTITTSILLIIHLSVTFQSRCSNSRVTVVSKQGNDVVAVIYFDAHTGAFSWQSALSVRIFPHHILSRVDFFSPPLPFFVGLSLR